MFIRALSFRNFLMENEHLDFGHSHLEVIETPGHMASDLTFKIGDAIFVGDSPFHHVQGEPIFLRQCRANV